jgi:hypothetical protein
MHAVCELVNSLSFIVQTESDIVEPFTWAMVPNIMETLEDWGDGSVTCVKPTMPRVIMIEAFYTCF